MPVLLPLGQCGAPKGACEDTFVISRDTIDRCFSRPPPLLSPQDSGNVAQRTLLFW